MIIIFFLSVLLSLSELKEKRIWFNFSLLFEELPTRALTVHQNMYRLSWPQSAAQARAPKDILPENRLSFRVERSRSIKKKRYAARRRSVCCWPSWSENANVRTSTAFPFDQSQEILVWPTTFYNAPWYVSGYIFIEDTNGATKGDDDDNISNVLVQTTPERNCLSLFSL